MQTSHRTALLFFVFAIKRLSLGSASPLPAPMWPGEAWVTEINDATRETSRHVNALRHVGSELVPLPESLPWPDQRQVSVHDHLAASLQSLTATSPSWHDPVPLREPSGSLEHFALSNPVNGATQPLSQSHTEWSPPVLHAHDLTWPTFQGSGTDKWALEHIVSAEFNYDTRPRAAEIPEQPSPRAAQLQHVALGGQADHAVPQQAPMASMLSTSRNRKAVYDPTPTLEWLDVAHPLEYPRVVELPNDLRWDPSPALAGELLSLFESRLGYSRTDVADLTGGDRARLAHDLPTFKEAFGMNRFVYVFKLPTRPVLITAHTRSLFRQDNPHPVALVLWTIDQDSARAPVLSLRAAFGVKIGLYAKMRRRPGKAVYNPGSWTDGPSPRRLLWLHSHD